MKLSIKVYGFYNDGQDGSGSIKLYRDKQDFIEKNTNKWKTAQEAEEEWNKAEEGDSYYDDGAIDETTIEFELVDGKLVLLNNPKLGWG